MKFQDDISNMNTYIHTDKPKPICPPLFQSWGHNNRELYQWHCQTSQPDFARCRRIVPAFHVQYFWILSNRSPKVVNACKSAIQMISCILDCDVQLCCKCNFLYKNVVDHCISECKYLHSERVKLWDRIYKLSPLVYTYLRSLDTISLTSFLLGEVRPDFIPGNDMCTFWSVVLPSLLSIWIRYKLKYSDKRY